MVLVLCPALPLPFPPSVPPSVSPFSSRFHHLQATLLVRCLLVLPSELVTGVLMGYVMRATSVNSVVGHYSHARLARVRASASSRALRVRAPFKLVRCALRLANCTVSTIGLFICALLVLGP